MSLVYSQVWLALADVYIKSLKLDWEKTKKFAFNERSNPDDNTLGMQIVKVSRWYIYQYPMDIKTFYSTDYSTTPYYCYLFHQDLHRTGCSGFSGDDNDEERALLKRVLLAYARWNKRVGYCQGFNVLAALILDVMGRKEDDALKASCLSLKQTQTNLYYHVVHIRTLHQLSQ